MTTLSLLATLDVHDPRISNKFNYLFIRPNPEDKDQDRTYMRGVTMIWKKLTLNFNYTKIYFWHGMPCWLFSVKWDGFNDQNPGQKFELKQWDDINFPVPLFITDDWMREKDDEDDEDYIHFNILTFNRLYGQSSLDKYGELFDGAYFMLHAPED